MKFNNNKTDEFYWEMEFRKDDIKTNSCMHEIPAVIDLPGEDELLMKKLQKHPEYTNTKKQWDDTFFSDNIFDFDDVFFPENWQKCEGADIYSELESLTEEWCRIYAADPTDYGLKIICHYGNITGFAIDLMDFGEEKMPGLKIALCKRIYSGINKIMSLISNANSNPEKIQNHINKLLTLQGKVTTHRFKLKNS